MPAVDAAGGHAAPGSRGALLALAERVLRLAGSPQVTTALPEMDIEQLQRRASEAIETLNISSDGPLARPLVESSTPSLYALAVECIKVVERAELSTYLAHVVAAGCEVFSELLDPQTREDRAGWSYNWVDDALEDLSDQVDFLALEVYCGLGRLEGAALESHALPVVLDPGQDHFGRYWGSLEHRQALQELSAWLLCVVFRLMGYDAVSARSLMEFANHDVLCLCALLRGLLAVRPGHDDGLPRDARELQSMALNVLCGLTAPELAFPRAAGRRDEEEEAEGIEEQTRLLGFYLEVLCAAVVETGLLEEALNAVLVLARAAAAAGREEAAESTALGVRFLGFLAALTARAEAAEEPTAVDPSHPALRLRAEVARRADGLGMVLEAALAVGVASSEQLKEVALACAGLSAALAAQGSPDGEEDGFTLACRVLLSTCLDGGLPQGPESAATLAALAAVAVNVGDWEVSQARLAELAGRLPPEGRRRACARLARTDCMRLPVRGGPEPVIALFAHAGAATAQPLGVPQPPAPAQAAEAARAALPQGPGAAAPALQARAVPAAAPAAAAASAAGVRDLVENAPKALRCALDGKLLCDPVVSPGGIVFERATLVRWLQTHPAQCPITGQPLQLADCQRSPELRRQVTEWVRGPGRSKEPKKKGR